jgi:phosphatidate cytidylyltransferase
MLRTRLWIGAALVIMMVAVLYFDIFLAPFFPILATLVGVAGFLAAIELRKLLPSALRPNTVLAIVAVEMVLLSPWLALAAFRLTPGHVDASVATHWAMYLFAGAIGIGFLVEMWTFHGPDGAIGRMCGLTFMAAYLGLLTCFLTNLRWIEPLSDQSRWARSTAALILCILTPKVGDIAAFFTGRAFGAHPMSPVLSPKKTIEGAMGGIVGATLFALAIQLIEPVARGGVLSAMLLGAVLGVVGIFGDLAESLLKRDAKAKDASQAVPGFGGVLDVIDSILFCAPVTYCWLV